MPRSSFSENPLLRVSRPVSACSRCRSAKVKCDGKLPACTACEKAGRENECSAANDQFARGKERSYVAALELRIEKLERRLAYARSRKASLAQHDPEAPPEPQTESERKDSLANIRAAIYRKAARKREASDVNSLMSDFGFLSINATTRDFEPSINSDMTFARLVLAATANAPLPASPNWMFPARQEALSIVQNYMSNVYSLFPAFDETELYRNLDQLYMQDDIPLMDIDYWLVYMVLAVGSTAQSQTRNDEHYINGINFASRALEYADRALMPGHSLQLRSLLLLTQYSMLDPTHFDSWHLIGFTCRAVVDLGYHQDPPSEQVPDKHALDLRRKVFYCIYSMDRSISMVHARAFAFTDDATNVGWPRPHSFSRRASISGQLLSGSEPAFLLFQLRRAQSHWYQTLFQSGAQPLPDAESFIWRMCQEMREWTETLPSTLPVGMRELFELEVRYSLVYCLSPSSRAPYMTDYARMLIFEHALFYLDRMHEIAHNGRSMAFYTYHDALRVFFMASQFIAVLRDAENLFLAGITVAPPQVEYGKVPPPPLPHRPGGVNVDNVERCLQCLERTSMTLGKYGQRWDDAMLLKQGFDHITGDLIERLRVRRQIKQQSSPRQTVSPPREMRWVGVDVESMLKGNNNGSKNIKQEQ